MFRASLASYMNGIQDAPSFLVTVYKVHISLYFPPYLGSLQPEHRLCSDKAFLFRLFLQTLNRLYMVEY